MSPNPHYWRAESESSKQREDDEKLLWCCEECDDEFWSDPTEHHHQDSCDCGDAWVDHESYQLRRSFTAIPVMGEHD